MSDLMNELFRNALDTDFKDKSMNDIFYTSNIINAIDRDYKSELINNLFSVPNLEEEKILEAKNYFLFKKTKHNGRVINLKIIIFRDLNLSYILEKDKVTKVEKEVLNSNETLKYIIEILYREYDIGFDIISKILFSEFLEKFMKNVNDLELKIGYDRSYSAKRSHEKRENLHT